MPLSPEEINNKEFSRRLRGYDEDQVNEFLRQILNDYETLIRENQTLQNRINDSQDKLTHFANIEETLSKTIVVAQEAADELRANAKKEAQLIVKEAEKNADRIINDSLAKARKISLDMEELKKQASIYRLRFRSLIESQMDLLAEEEWKTVDQRELQEAKV